MSDVYFECRHCGQHMEAASSARGQITQCPGCQKDVVIPSKKHFPAGSASVVCFILGGLLAGAGLFGERGCLLWAAVFFTWGILLQILAAIPRR